MIRDDVARLVEPEGGQLCEHLAFVGDAGAEDVVERRDAIGGDEQQLVADLVDVAHLALPMRRAAVEPCFEDRSRNRQEESFGRFGKTRMLSR